MYKPKSIWPKGSGRIMSLQLLSPSVATKPQAPAIKSAVLRTHHKTKRRRRVHATRLPARSNSRFGNIATSKANRKKAIPRKDTAVHRCRRSLASGQVIRFGCFQLKIGSLKQSLLESSNQLIDVRSTAALGHKQTICLILRQCPFWGVKQSFGRCWNNEAIRPSFECPLSPSAVIQFLRVSRI